MHYTNFLFSVSSAEQANELRNICATYFTDAVITSLGLLDGKQDAHAVVRCSYENCTHGHMACSKTLHHLAKVGLSKNLR